MPPVPNGSVRINLNWSIESGQEIAVSSLWGLLGVTTPIPSEWADAQDVATALAPGMQNGMDSGLSASMSNTAKLATMEVYLLEPTTGKAAGKGTHDFADLAKGSQSGQMLPPTNAATVQLWGYPPTSWTPNARSRRGRIAMPAATTSAVSTDGRVAQTYAENVTAAWRIVFNAWRALTFGGHTFEPTIYSRLLHDHISIKAVSMSNLWGVQRRRENALVRTHFDPVTVG